MVATGWNSTDSYFSDCTVMDLDNSNMSCSALPDFPVATSRADGGFVNGTLVICPSWGVSNTDCYKFDHMIDHWTLVARVEPRR